MRPLIHVLLGFLLVGCLAGACSGPAGGGDVLPTDATSDVDAADVTECPAGLVPWPGGGCAPLVPECKNPWELPLIGGGCVAIGPRACPKLWDPEADVDCEPGQLMEYDGNACPDGFVLTDDEVACIPFFVEDGSCGENEIPVLGGGCQAVGPRACPKTWNPEADVDCEPGQFMEYDGSPCPDGFVLTEDEAACIPFFAEDGVCGDNEIPVLGGGCQPVGPRACPKLWDPDADVDCEVGDVLPCPEGWSESEDGMYCDPKYGECGPGERSLVGGGCERVVPLAADCPVGPYPAVPEGAEDVVYVSAASTCAEGCGSAVAPFSTITSALAAVPDGGYVLVGAGEYAEGLSITKPVHVLGLCSAKVAIVGSVVVVSEYESEVDTAGIAVTDTTGVEIFGVKVASAAAGLAVVGSVGMEVHDVEVTGSAGVGVYVGPGSELAIDRLWLHDTTLGSKAWLLFGVFAEGGAKLVLKKSLLDATMGAGVFAREAKTDLTVNDTTIRDTRCTAGEVAGYGARVDNKASLRVSASLLDSNRDMGILAEGGGILEMAASAVLRTQPNDKGERGGGLWVHEKATTTVSDCLLDGNTEVGIVVSGAGTQMNLLATVVRDAKPNGEGEFGYGMEVREGASVAVSGCLFEGNTELGILVGHPGTEVDLSATVLRETLPNEDGEFGFGMQASDGASVSVSGCLFDGNRDMGISVWNLGTEAVLSATVVRDTMPDGEGESGIGMLVLKGAAVSVSGCLFEGNTAEDIHVDHSGTELDLSATVVRDTIPDGEGESGNGMQVGEGADASVCGCLFEGNAETGIGVFHSGTKMDLSVTVVRDTRPNGEGKLGRGMQVSEGAAVSSSGCLFAGNTAEGILVRDSGTELDLSATVVKYTMPEGSGEFGWGMQVSEGAAVSSSGCLFDGNTEMGVGVSGRGMKMDLSATVVRHTMPNGSGESGWGMQVSEGAMVSVTGCLFEGNKAEGIVVWDSGTELDLSATAVRDTMPNGKGKYGRGMQTSGGTAVSVTGCLFEGNTEVGILVWDSDTEMSLSATVARDTMPNGEGEGGHGMQVSSGASVTVSGCLFEGNTNVGIGLLELDTKMELVATIVRDTKPDENGEFGIGVFAENDASISIFRSRLLNNTTAGAFATEGGALSLDASAVLASLTGGIGRGSVSQVYGDGVVAAFDSRVDVVSTILAGNGRNGIYFNKASGSVTDSVIFGNDFYGLAMEECAGDVKWEGKGNYILDNASALPPDKAAQVTTSTGGMPVPPAPEMMGVPSGPVE